MSTKSILRMIVFSLLIVLSGRLFERLPIDASQNNWTWLGLNGTAYEVVADPVNPSVVYVRLDFDQIMRTEDGGQSWLDITPGNFDPSSENLNSLAIAPSMQDVLYAATFEGGVYRTVDGGSTWDLVYDFAEQGYWVHSIEVSQLDWNEVYLIRGEYGPGPFDRSAAIYRSIDGGYNWQLVWQGNNQEVDQIYTAPSAPHILFAKPFYNGVNDFLLKSVDYGQTWSSISIPGASWRSFTVDPTNANTLYLGSDSPSAWKSADGGVSWQPITGGLTGLVFGFAIDIDNTQVIHVAAHDNGVFESTDGGSSWATINNGIDGIIIYSIAVTSRTPLTIFAGGANAGVWKLVRTDVQDFSISINNGALFTNQTSVTLNLTAPSGTTQMMISNDGGFGGSSWEAYNSTKPWALEAFGSYVIPRTVYVKFKTGGVTSGVYQDDIILDQTPPSGNISIAQHTHSNGEIRTNKLANSIAIYHSFALTSTVYLPLVRQQYIPGFRVVNLLLSATDDLSGVDRMVLSDESSFTNAQWQPFSSTFSMYVSDAGPVTIYVKYRDRAGNESPVYSVISTVP